jgi:hypothetical protein
MGTMAPDNGGELEAAIEIFSLIALMGKVVMAVAVAQKSSCPHTPWQL